MQDDFFIFSIARAANIKEYLNFFIPRVDTTNLRPLCLQTYYFTFYHLFGLNTFYYHLLPFIIHALNGVLIFNLLSLFFKKTLPVAVASFLFVISWTHFYSLSWIVCNCNEISLLFILLYFLTFLKSNTRRLFIPEIMIILSLFANETGVIAPFLLLLILVFIKKTDKKSLFRVIFHFLIVAFYVYYRFILHQAPTTSTYAIGLSMKSIKNLGFFILWLFNASEEMVIHLKYYGLFFFTDSWFLKEFPIYAPFICSFLSLTVLFLLYLFAKKRRNFNFKIIILGANWFTLGILPVLFIPNRVYPYYPYLAQIGFWIIFAHLLTNRFSIINKIFLLLFISANIFTLVITYQTHWLIQESLQAKYYLKKFEKIELPKNAANVLIPINDNQTRNALMEGKAFNVFLNNYKINFYLEEKNVPPALRKKIYKVNIQ